MRYLQYREDSGVNCAFCAPPAEQIVHADGDLLILKNKFPYLVWDECPVSEHLLLVPRAHVLHPASIADDARASCGLALDDYVMRGYSAYVRGPDNAARSVAHFHWHLFRLEPARIDRFIFLRRPYWLWATASPNSQA